MASPRANWKGFVRCGEISVPVALYSASSSSERIAFNILNRQTGNPVRREYVDSGTDEVVGKDDQIRGYEVASGQFVTLEREEVAAAVPESDKTMTVTAFVPYDEIDTVFFDKPYYLAPDRMGHDAFALLREGMRRANVAAVAKSVLSRRMKTLLIVPDDEGMVATTLKVEFEVRSADHAFDDMPDLKITGEMLDLATHIVRTKTGEFRPADFSDRYEAALADLVKAKMEGRTLPKLAEPRVSRPPDLLQALRGSVEALAAPANPRRSGTGTDARESRAGAKRKRPAAASRKTG